MSVLIKGMEMPIDCPYYPLAHWNFKNEFMGCEIAKKHFSTEELYADGRPEFCPLVPVPEHGRLVDADAYKQEMKDCRMAFWDEVLDSMPTIIPADKEGE